MKFTVSDLPHLVVLTPPIQVSELIDWLYNEGSDLDGEWSLGVVTYASNSSEIMAKSVAFSDVVSATTFKLSFS